MKNVESRKGWYIALLVIGIALYVSAGFMELMDDFWGGLGLGFIIISALRLVQIVRYQKNDDYAKKVIIAHNDERNQFLANKARSTAFSISVLLEAVVSLGFHLMGKVEIAQVILLALCVQVIVYYVSYLILKSKY